MFRKVSRLPCGWLFGLSNEFYTESMGTSYEGIGVRVNVPAANFSLDAIAKEIDLVLDALLVTLGFLSDFTHSY